MLNKLIHLVQDSTFPLLVFSLFKFFLKFFLIFRRTPSLSLLSYSSELIAINPVITYIYFFPEPC